jgi:hypothetical protein
VVHTFVAIHSLSVTFNSAASLPITFSDRPYIGELSITFPPASTNARNTFLIGDNSFSESPTSKVIHEPNPIAGINSPEAGIFRVTMVVCGCVLRTSGKKSPSETAVDCFRNKSLDMLFLSPLVIVKITKFRASYYVRGYGRGGGFGQWS